MDFIYKCLVVIHCCLLLQVHARYNKDVICILNKDKPVLCKTFVSQTRRSNDYYTPSHEPYIPTIKDAVFYNCTSTQCHTIKVHSIAQIAVPKSRLQICYRLMNEKYECRPLNYFYYKDIDKLLFLSNNIAHKTFYLIDCLAYSDGGRVCHKKNDVDSYAKLVDTGNVARPNETNILSQEEFICEQSVNFIVNCDLNLYVPYVDGLQRKQSNTIDDKILLKFDTSLMILKYNCIGGWCGYSGKLLLKRGSRRHDSTSGGRLYKCYYANKQQICKLIQDSHKSVYNARDWLSS